MTAKELRQWAINDEGGIYVFSPDELKAFCEQLCLEQRLECGKVYEFASLDTDLGMYETIRDDIENANMPEL